MQSIADGLPPDVARQIHPDWRKNEADYWKVRDQLIGRHADRWIAFAEGAVIAVGNSPVEILHEAQQSGKHPYVTCVGREHEPCRMRRAAIAYDQSCPGEALPLVAVEPGRVGCTHHRWAVKTCPFPICPGAIDAAWHFWWAEPTLLRSR